MSSEYFPYEIDEETCKLDHKETNNLASIRLSRKFYNGSLMLVLGSGVSAGVKFPQWAELIKRCASDENVLVKEGMDLYCSEQESKEALKADKYVKDNEFSFEKALSIMGKVRNKFDDYRDYLIHVRKCLYRDVDFTNRPYEIMQDETLLTIGSLVSQSVNGRIKNIVTYNFDGVLEWYLAMQGFKVQVITSPEQLLEDADVRIYHPHGYLPVECSFWDWEKEMSDFLIFDKKSYWQRMKITEINTWMFQLFNLFMSKQVIFHGLSGDDWSLNMLCSEVNEKLPKSDKNRFYVGYWLLKEPDSSKHNNIREEFVNEYGCMPLFFPDHIDKSLFLLQLRQRVALG